MKTTKHPTIEMTWAKTIMSNVKETKEADNKVAVFASRPLIGYMRFALSSVS